MKLLSKILIICISVIAPQFLIANVRLNFPVNTPVQITSRMEIDIQESMPILHLASHGKQALKFEVTILPAHNSSTKLARLPFSLVLTLRDLFVDLGVNKENFVYDSRTSTHAIPLLPFSQAINTPLHFTLDTHNQFKEEPEAFSKLFKEYPILKDLKFEEFIYDFLRHIFALNGKDLQINTLYTHTFPDDQAIFFPKQIEYQITQITDEKITAQAKANFSSPESALNVPNKNYATDIRIAINGQLSATMSWHRRNALLYQMDMSYSSQSQLKSEAQQWTIEANLTHKITSASL